MIKSNTNPSAGRIYPFVRRLLHAGLILTATAAGPASADFTDMERIVSNAGGITVLTQRPGDPNRMVVGSKEGLIRIFDLQTGAFQPAPFLNLINQLDTESEGGLTGLAFHPDFATNGEFYVTVTVDNGGTPVDPVNHPGVLSPYSAQVRKYTVSANPDVANTSFETVVSWVKPQFEHTGGWLGFGPQDGYLYVATGDGGGFYDVTPGHTPGIGNAQDLTDNLLGKILRLDVSHDAFPADPNRTYAIPPDNPWVGEAGDDEIFAYGLRSPWGLSFDRLTGDLWIGDVGQDFWEEVDVLPAGSGGGQNYGWRLREGLQESPLVGVGGPKPAGNVDPVYDYSHLGQPGDPDFLGNSVTGGFVYRGPDPELQGQYVFADFISSQFWMFDPEDPFATVENITAKLQPPAGGFLGVTTFAQDAQGNLYAATIGGDVFRLTTDRVWPGDFNADGSVDGQDLAVWRNDFGTPGEHSDADGDGIVNGADLLIWQRNYGKNVAGVAAQAVPEPAAAVLLALALVTVLAARRSAN